MRCVTSPSAGKGHLPAKEQPPAVDAFYGAASTLHNLFAGPEGDTKMVLDGTWLVHLPKVVWWLVCEGNLGFFLYRFYQPHASDGNGCYSPGWTQTSSALIVVSLLRRDTTQLMQVAFTCHSCLCSFRIPCAIDSCSRSA